MEYILQSDGTVKQIGQTEIIIDVPALQKELAEINKLEYPSDQELLDHAKGGVIHPYFEFQERKQQIETILAELEGVI